MEIHEKLSLDNITYDFRPPIYADKEMRGDLEMIREGWLKSWDDLEAMKAWLPDPNDDAFYENAEKLERVGTGGGYIIASANGLTSYCKPENVMAMNDTILEFGYYS